MLLDYRKRAYDLEKVVESCQIYRTGAESYLVIDAEGVLAVEQLILAKHQITEQVYARRVCTIRAWN